VSIGTMVAVGMTSGFHLCQLFLNATDRRCQRIDQLEKLAHALLKNLELLP
jgi:hypothetical protein